MCCNCKSNYYNYQFFYIINKNSGSEECCEEVKAIVEEINETTEETNLIVKEIKSDTTDIKLEITEIKEGMDELKECCEDLTDLVEELILECGKPTECKYSEDRVVINYGTYTTITHDLDSTNLEVMVVYKGKDITDMVNIQILNPNAIGLTLSEQGGAIPKATVLVINEDCDQVVAAPSEEITA